MPAVSCSVFTCIIALRQMPRYLGVEFLPLRQGKMPANLDENEKTYCICGIGGASWKRMGCGRGAGAEMASRASFARRSPSMTASSSGSRSISHGLTSSHSPAACPRLASHSTLTASHGSYAACSGSGASDSGLGVTAAIVPL